MMWKVNSASSSSDNNLVVRNNFYKGLRKDDFAVVIQYFPSTMENELHLEDF